MKPVQINASAVLSRLLVLNARLAKARSRQFDATRDVELYEREIKKATPEGVNFYGQLGVSPNDLHQLTETFVCQALDGARRCGKATQRASYTKPALSAKLFCDKHAATPLPDGAEDEPQKKEEASSEIPF